MPVKKYQTDGGPGVPEISAVVNGLTVGRSRRQFFDSLAFNATIGNTDVHAKNYSILIATGATVLAPLYDVGSTYGYEPKSKPRSAIKIGDHYLLSQISTKDWLGVAKRLALPEDVAVDRLVTIQQILLTPTARLSMRCPTTSATSSEMLESASSPSSRVCRK